MNQLKSLQQPTRYQYKGFWIQVFFESQFELQLGDELSCFWATVETDTKLGIISTRKYPDQETAEFAAEELIDSWN